MCLIEHISVWGLIQCLQGKNGGEGGEKVRQRERCLSSLFARELSC